LVTKTQALMAWTAGNRKVQLMQELCRDAIETEVRFGIAPALLTGDSELVLFCTEVNGTAFCNYFRYRTEKWNASDVFKIIGTWRRKAFSG
jgi:hypothetical protein